MDTLQISTGEKKIPVVRDGVSVGEITFNPQDVVFAEKFYRLINEFQMQFAQYQARARELEQDQTTDENGIPVHLDQQIALTKEACQFAYEQIDTLFGAGISAMVFGESFVPDTIIQFFNGIAPFVQKVRAEKVAKYVPVRANGKKHRKRANGN